MDTNMNLAPPNFSTRRPVESGPTSSGINISSSIGNTAGTSTPAPRHNTGSTDGVSSSLQDLPVENSHHLVHHRHQQLPTATSIRQSLTKLSRSPSHSHKLSSSSTASGSVTSRKSRHAEPGTTDTHAERASLSMPPPLSRPVKGAQLSLPRSRRESSNSEAWSEDLALANGYEHVVGSLGSLRYSPRDIGDLSWDTPSPAALDTEEFDTPRLLPSTGNASSDPNQHRQLPDPALPPSSGSSYSDGNIWNVSKRMSTSSMYSQASARGVPSSAASANGSDNSTGTGPAPGPGSAHRSVSGLLSSSAGKGLSSAQSEAGLSNVTVTTGSQPSTGTHHLAPRDTHMHHLSDMIKRNSPAPPRSDPAANASSRPQPTRSRSRAKRRFSGSTAASSHSPSSDRAAYVKEKEEGMSAGRGHGVSRRDANLDSSQTSPPRRHWSMRARCQGEE